jgi:hypothetical protein
VIGSDLLMGVQLKCRIQTIKNPQGKPEFGIELGLDFRFLACIYAIK